MTEATFRSRRRQKFLTERFYELNKSWLSTLILENESEERNNVSPSDPAFAGIAGSTFKEKLNLLKLHYTAGSPIEALLPLYTDAVNALGNWHEAYLTYIKALAAESGDELREDSTPLEFEDLYAFQIAIDMVSLGVLFGDGAALRRIAVWLHPYRSDDILFEELVSRAVPDPQRDITEYFHGVPGAGVSAEEFFQYAHGVLLVVLERAPELLGLQPTFPQRLQLRIRLIAIPLPDGRSVIGCDFRHDFA